MGLPEHLREFLPIPNAPAGAIAIAVGAQRACALFENDVVRCAGLDDVGAVSGHAPPARGIATTVQGLTPVLDMAVSAGRAAAVDGDGHLWTWGPQDAVARRSSTSTRFIAVAATTVRLCAVARGGAVHVVEGPDGTTVLRGIRVRAVGEGQRGRLVAESMTGVPSLLRADVDAPELTAFPALRGASDVRIVGFEDSLCGIIGGRLVCSSRAQDAETMPTFAADVTRFFADPQHRVVVLAGGEVRIWGLDDVAPGGSETSGLRRPPTAYQPEPVAAPSLAGITGLWLDGSFTRLGADGVVQRIAAGASDDGWDAVAGLEEVGEIRRVSANGLDGCVLDADGSVRCWGQLARADGQRRDVGMDAWVTVPMPAG